MHKHGNNLTRIFFPPFYGDSILLSSKQKIFLARTAYHVVMLSRRLVGKGKEGYFTRAGLRWKLNLEEGIDFSIFLLGTFEPKTVSAYNALLVPGAVALDIGANIGAHTLHIAKCVGEKGQVFAFEPTDFAYNRLLENMELNPDIKSRIHVSQMLLTDDESDQAVPEIYSSWPLTDDSDLHPKHRGRLKSTTGARPKTLDRFVTEHGLQRVDFIKLDVDGNEIHVLGGAQDTLKKFKPVIAMELAPYVLEEAGTTINAMLDLLYPHGYQLEDENTGKPLPSNPDQLKALVPDGTSMNVIARAPL